MGAYKYIKQNFQKGFSERNDLLKHRLQAWRDEETVVRLQGPTNIARARELGYKAKQGVIMARVKTSKGMTKRIKASGGRKPSKSGRFYSYKKSAQAVAEDRAARKFSNAEVLNSYYIAEDGKFTFFEVILLDRTHPAIIADEQYSGVIGMKGRSYRGLTMAGIRHRGIASKGQGSNAQRPSVRSVERTVRIDK